MNWQLNQIQYPIYNLGPGKRIGIWTQGCTLGCAGCINQTLWKKSAGAGIEVLDVFNWVAERADEFDGITISGGEPFEQYESLIAFLYLIKTRTKLTAYCFSGYSLEELNSRYTDKLFYRYLDFLIDGRYAAELHEDNNLRGSSNQTIYQFVDQIPVKQNEIAASRKWSVRVSRENSIHMAGIPKKGELDQLSKNLSLAGINKLFK